MAYYQEQKITNSSGALNYAFGNSVDIDGFYSVVGEAQNDSVYIHKRTIDGDWILIKTLTFAAGSSAGISVAVKPNYIAIGANDLFSIGGVAVYYDNGDDSWTNAVAVISSDGAVNDQFGTSVAINENYLVVGAPGKNNNSGVVYVFERTGENSWSEISKLTSSSQTASDYFGISIGLSGTTIVVGSSGDNSGTGAVYIFDIDEDSGEVSQIKKLFASDGRAGDGLGGSVSISSNYMVAGARFKTSSSNDLFAGAAYIYKFSNTWYEVDKLEGINESYYVGNRFGSSVYIKGDYIIVGSPEARDGEGVADIYYKKRGWNHLIKLVADDAGGGDNFGTFVAIDSPFAIVGSPGDDDIAGNAGACYIFNDSKALLRLSQEFEVDGSFVPSKATLYLKRMGKNSGEQFAISNTDENVIDATNFINITKGSNRVYMDDTIGGFTGNGYMILDKETDPTFDVINYPIRAIADDTFNLWIRCISLQSIFFKADILIDGNLSKTIDVEVNNPSVSEWIWVSTSLVLPDTSNHILGIRIKESRAAIDKIYIDTSSSVPYATGPEYSLSPYVTSHVKLYRTNSGGEPTDQLFVYDYKNTINHIVADDWYNFDIKSMDNDHGFILAEHFLGNYAIVLSSSGGDNSNFIVWEIVDNDEYLSSPSAIKI